MKLKGALLALTAAGVVAGAAACAFDFNQFEPIDASARPTGTDSSKQPPASDAGTPMSDAEVSDDATVDVAEPQDAGPGDVGAPRDGGGPEAAPPCTPSQGCLMTAQMCATMCATQEQMCSMRCSSGGCRVQCRNTQATCNTQCQDTCTTCTQSAGCSSRAACADAG